MANPAMETRARIIFRDALHAHYIVGLEAGEEVYAWLRTHGGWFPDPQGDFDGETPADQGATIMSSQPVQAMEDAKKVMQRLHDTLAVTEEPDELGDAVCKWLSPAAPRCRSRSRSPLRVRPLPDLARAALDVVCKRDADDRIESQRQTIARLQQELASKNAEIASLKAGDGAIGPILARNLPSNAPESMKQRVLAKSESVSHYLRRLRGFTNALNDEVLCGCLLYTSPSPRD